MEARMWLLLGLLVGCKKDEPESTAPAPAILKVAEPQIAAYIPAGTVTVSGTASGMHDVTVNGLPVAMSGDAFSLDLDAPRGLVVVETAGLSEDGHTLFDRRGVLAGTFGAPEGAVAHAADLRLNRSGLDTLLADAASILEPGYLFPDLSVLNPVYTDSFVFGAATVTADLGALAWGPVRMTADPAPGVLHLSAVMPDLVVDVPVYGEILGVFYDTSATMTCAAVNLDADLTLSVDAGDLQIGVADVSVTLDDFYFDTSAIPSEIEGWLLADTVAGTVEGLLVEQITTLVPSLLDSQLSGLELAFAMTLLDVPLEVAATFADGGVDADGVWLSTDVDVAIAPASDRPYAGFLLSPGGDASPDRTSDLAMSLSDDLVNRALFEAWRGGLLDMTLSSEDGTLEPIFLSQLGATDSATVNLQPALPPILVQGADGGLELDLGELGVEILTPGGTYGERVLLAVNARVPVEITASGAEIALDIGEPALDLMVRENDWGAGAGVLTSVIEDDLPISTLLLLLGTLSFPIPELTGISLDSAVITRDASGSWSTVSVDLQ